MEIDGVKYDGTIIDGLKINGTYYSFSNYDGIKYNDEYYEFREYPITTNFTNVTMSGATSIKRYHSTTIILSADDDYMFTSKNNVTVSGAEYTFVYSTGKLTISKPTGAVEITATAYSGEIRLFAAMEGHEDDDGNIIYEDEDGNTLTQVTDDDGKTVYYDEDGNEATNVAYDIDTDTELSGPFVISSMSPYDIVVGIMGIGVEVGYYNENDLSGSDIIVENSYVFDSYGNVFVRIDGASVISSITAPSIGTSYTYYIDFGDKSVTVIVDFTEGITVDDE